MSLHGKSSQRRRGWTLVEFATALLVVGIVASFGIPRLVRATERNRAAEAFVYLSEVGAAQDGYHREHGVYASDLGELQLVKPLPKHFRVGHIAPSPGRSLKDSWSLTLSRVEPPSRFGPYTVTFNESGFNVAGSSACRFQELGLPGR
jgi:type II secretory pathway pseudopilin PulG